MLVGSALMEVPSNGRWKCRLTLSVTFFHSRVSGIAASMWTESWKLGLIPVFITTISPTALHQQLQGIRHCGICGPTKSGHLIVRAKEKEVGEARKTLLGSTSAFSKKWDLLINLSGTSDLLFLVEKRQPGSWGRFWPQEKAWWTFWIFFLPGEGKGESGATWRGGSVFY